MPGYTTLRLKKLKSAGSIRNAFMHNTRQRTPAYVYPERTGRNFVDRTTEASMQRYAELLPAKVRKNAVHAVEFIVQAPPDTSDATCLSYFNASLFWLLDKLGGKDNRLNYAIHYDEESPHFHLVMMPLRDGRLNYNSYLGGKKYALRELQTDFARDVGSRFGFVRGIERSGIEHRGHNTYRRQMAEPLADLPTVTLPKLKFGLLTDVASYGEHVASLYQEAYAPVLERLKSVTNKVKILEQDNSRLKIVNSGRAREYDELRAQYDQLRAMVIAGGSTLDSLRANLLQEDADRRAKELEKSKPRRTSRDKGRDGGIER
jgi:hypothetical protein